MPYGFPGTHTRTHTLQARVNLQHIGTYLRASACTGSQPFLEVLGCILSIIISHACWVFLFSCQQAGHAHRTCSLIVFSSWSFPRRYSVQSLTQLSAAWCRFWGAPLEHSIDSSPLCSSFVLYVHCLLSTLPHLHQVSGVPSTLNHIPCPSTLSAIELSHSPVKTPRHHCHNYT